MTTVDVRHGNLATLDAIVPVLLVIVGSLVYLTLALRQRRIGRGWSTWRTVACLTGGALLVLGLSPALLPYAHGDFRQHMLSHLLIGMIAPLALVLSAPITLLVRALPRHGARLLVGLLRTGYLRLLARPEVALVLNIGGMAVLYFTPLYDAASSDRTLHHAVQLHFLLAGYLFAWVIAGPDPAPHRPGVPYRLVVLGVAIAVHASLAQLMYAGAFVAVDAPLAELRGGAVLMYYGGDIADLLLAFALVSTWHPGRATRSGQVAPVPAPDPE